MKKILFLLAMLPMMLACSSSNDEPEEEFDFIQLEVNTTSKSKIAELALFYGWEGSLKNVSFTYKPHDGTMVVGDDDSDEYLMPITGLYAEEYKIKDGQLLHVYYVDDFNRIYGDASKGGKFAIAINIDGEKSFKVFDATKNTKVDLLHDGTSFKWSTRDY